MSVCTDGSRLPSAIAPLRLPGEQHRPEQQERDQDVHPGPREDHRDALPRRLRVVGAPRRLGLEPPDLFGVHAGDLHVAPRGDRADRVLGLPPAHAEKRRREEQREALHPHAHGLGDGEVPELVQHDQHDDAEEGQDPAHGPSVAGGGPDPPPPYRSPQDSGRMTHYGVCGSAPVWSMGDTRVLHDDRRSAQPYAGDVPDPHPGGRRARPGASLAAAGFRRSAQGRAACGRADDRRGRRTRRPASWLPSSSPAAGRGRPSRGSSAPRSTATIRRHPPAPGPPPDGSRPRLNGAVKPCAISCCSPTGCQRAERLRIGASRACDRHPHERAEPPREDRGAPRALGRSGHRACLRWRAGARLLRRAPRDRRRRSSTCSWRPPPAQSVARGARATRA